MKIELEALIFEGGVFVESGGEMSFFQNRIAKKISEWRDAGLKTAGLISYEKENFDNQKWRDTQLFDVLVNAYDPAGLLNSDVSFLLRSSLEKLGIAPGKCGLVAFSEEGLRAGVREGCGFLIDPLNKDSKKDQEKIISGISLDAFFYDGKIFRYPVYSDKIPLFWKKIEELAVVFHRKKPIFFFDFDGTLSPIVAHPEDAELPASTKKLLSKLAESSRLTIISGRDMKDVKNRTDLKKITYAGSHGFEIDKGDDVGFSVPEGAQLKKDITRVTSLLRKKLNDFSKVEIEQKKYAVAVHYRNVPKKNWEGLKEAVNEVVDLFSSLKISKGKRVMEIRSRQDWDKGKAMIWMTEQINYSAQEDLLVYIGDDLTDEDAFRVIPEMGLGILVGDHEERSYADVRIAGSDEIDRLISWFIDNV